MEVTKESKCVTTCIEHESSDHRLSPTPHGPDFPSILPEVRKEIEECAFIAFDTEFTGQPGSPAHHTSHVNSH